MPWSWLRGGSPMPTKTYKARVKLSNGNTQIVEVRADNGVNAKAMLEAQYGKGSVLSYSEVS
jgi:hypothetical protein